MTGRERLIRAYTGLELDRVPWTPMVYQWFWVNKYNGTLPPEIAACETAMDALREMKADVFAKHEAFCVYAGYSQCSLRSEYSGAKLRQPVVKSCMMDVFGPNGNIDFKGLSNRTDVISTPKGELTAEWVYDELAGAPFEGKHYLADFNRDFERVRALLSDIEFHINVDRWVKLQAELADDGVAHFRIPPTPLKILHWLAGPEQAIYFICDYPDKVMELVRLYEAKRLELVRKAADIPGTLVFTSGDNMDSMMYGPPFFDDFCGHSFRQISEVIHERGKLLFTHACGQLAGVIKLCADSGVDGMEGMAPPPLGDLGFGDARKLLGPKFVLQGGMTYTEEEMKGSDARGRIFASVRDLFETLPDKRRFVFSSGCCLSPRSSYENILALRDACWEYGRA